MEPICFKNAKEMHPFKYYITNPKESEIQKDPTTDESMGGSPGDVCEQPVTQKKGKKSWRMSCDVGEATKGIENEL